MNNSHRNGVSLLKENSHLYGLTLGKVWFYHTQMLYFYHVADTIFLLQNQKYLCVCLCAISSVVYGLIGTKLSRKVGRCTEKNSRDQFPWQPSCCHGNKKYYKCDTLLIYCHVPGNRGLQQKLSPQRRDHDVPTH